MGARSVIRFLDNGRPTRRVDKLWYFTGSMAQCYSDIYRRYLRLAAILCFSAAALGLADSSMGLTRAELYQATVPLADRSEGAYAAAFQAGLKIVLVRVTGRRTADEDAALAPLFNNARRYIQQYRGAPDNQVWVAFDGPAIERWLTQNGLPLWGHERPSTVVWLAVQTGPQAGTIVTADANSDLKAAIDAAADIRGVPLIWPSTADLQKNHLDYTTLSGTAPASLAETGHAKGAEGVLIGRANNMTATASVRWTYLFQDRSSEFSGMLEGVNRAADIYAGLFAASGSLAPVDIEVSGIAELRDYADVQTYLESQTFIAHVSVQGLSGDTVRFRLSTRGGVESLQHALALNGKLQSLPAGDNGIQRFQLRR
jgi:uncharacterized protein